MILKYDFYRNNSVTWFISVSLHEGTPLSIIEAISFGIPAIATDAGATSEIVNPTNGYVLPLEITADRLAELISSDRSDTYHSKRTNAYATWKERFNAEKNSKDMIDRMLALTVATQSEVKGDEQRR